MIVYLWLAEHEDAGGMPIYFGKIMMFVMEAVG